jgi:cell division protein FtsB
MKVRPRQIFSAGRRSWWSIGGTLAETIFDAGKRGAVTEQAWASYRGTVATYRETVLAAFQEVEDNLSSLRILSQELQQQTDAVAASQRYLNLANDPLQARRGQLPQRHHRADDFVEQSAHGVESANGTDDRERAIDQRARRRLGYSHPDDSGHSLNAAP